MIGGENPWRTLRARSDLVLRWKVLPAGMGGCWSPGQITLDPRLGRVELRCTLLHELVHDERRIGWPFATEATMEIEERAVRREAALRLVPLDQLEVLARARGELGEVSAWEVAAEFDVTEAVAWTAVRVLQGVLLDRARAEAARRVA